MGLYNPSYHTCSTPALHAFLYALGKQHMATCSAYHSVIYYCAKMSNHVHSVGLNGFYLTLKPGAASLAPPISIGMLSGVFLYRDGSSEELHGTQINISYLPGTCTTYPPSVRTPN